MGDVMEMTTWPSHQKVFYRVSGSGLSFEIRTRASAVLGLAEKPGNSCDICVIIGHQTSIRLNNYNNQGTTVRTHNILNDEGYKLFWLSWSNGYVRLGQGFERKPIISYTHKRDVKYVIFSSQEAVVEAGPVHWKVTVPPTCILEKPQTKSLTNGELVWVRSDYRSTIPDGALIGGYENENLYIIRAPHAGQMTLGKLVPSKAMGYISWGNAVYEKTEFEILCGFDCVWVACEDKIPVGAVNGGDIGNSTELYVGRALHLGHLIPGKVTPSRRDCTIPYLGKEVAKREYEILVSPNRNPLCANSFYIKHLDIGTDRYDLADLVINEYDESDNDEIISF